MNRNHQILFNVLLFSLTGFLCHGQEKRTFKETFNVGEDAVLNIDTSHTDIEFETWDKNQVEVVATIELEGATEEEANTFFEKDIIKIIGNSKEIEVSTVGSGFGVHAPFVYDFNDFNIVIPDIPEMPEIPELPEIIVIPELPPMPPIPFIEFDYDAFKEDGDKYLKKWKKEFNQNFDEEYQKELEEWGEQMKAMANEREHQREEAQKMRKEHEKMREEHQKVREEARAQREEVRVQMREEQRKIREARHQIRTRVHSDNDFNFYFSTDGDGKKYEVKKTIKVKMPKSVKLKMNVRHGEVKLAANTKNINASLSYASLLASTIDGNRTNIRASYSPVVVQQWNYGQLKTDYSETVDLKKVKDLKLNSVSSNVIIGELTDKAFVTNNLGTIDIESIADGFRTVNITVQNGEVDCKLPAVPFTIHVNETSSDFKYPSKLAMGSSSNQLNTNVHKGYYISNKDDKTITIDSRYSEVVLKE
ncbi:MULTISPECIES: hypothetical protein [Flavobacteriaceae]|uniref:hypothetical protein n=1 Tax=Flavobacteriaceae TaxID=49546 RepID=UPI001491823C|nr:MULTISPECIES: hypothetical protein [Allomuricauda]MDC6367472.1 hypothetical protein [Muricauda sp. AC10]